MSIEEIRDLVKQEKAFMRQQMETKRKAAEIINAAKEKAARMIEEVSDESYYEDILEQKSIEIEEKKRLIDKDTDENIKLLNRITAANRERTARFIVELVLGK